ncbi:hypothetical protein BK367_06490 [Escherichia coli]|nr:hypothetical protein BWI90_26525 [Escherichia coli]OJO75736.1 hypothetical protein BK327_24185 [Escherichia coli]OJP33479.1 hypothetical protein BK338_13350 [Escherichia coli]OJP36472.1 hypothetical protein BK339_16285 [Escherichia coli]OJP43211.1 hypothetical protein BK340_15575 [Escherichia coli]
MVSKQILIFFALTMYNFPVAHLKGLNMGNKRKQALKSPHACTDTATSALPLTITLNGPLIETYNEAKQ